MDAKIPDMGRNRSHKNRDLERYVKRDKRGYVRYKHPKMDKPEFFGTDVAAANEVAKILNVELSGHSGRINSILSPSRVAPGTSVQEVCDLFVVERIPNLKWSENYTRENKGRINTICAAIGDKSFTGLSVLDVNSVIDDCFKGDGRRLARNVLIHVYKFAIGKGIHTGSNVAEQVLEIPKGKRVRQRIANFKEFETIRSYAAPWLQDAMDLSLITLQARQELCAMLLKDDQGDILKVVRQKTAKKTDKAYIDIEVGSDLRKVLTRCKIEAMRRGSPYMLNHLSRSRLQSKVKTHHCQVLPGFLSKEFKKVINKCGLYDHLSPEKRPTLHELRSLGGRLYKAMDNSEEFIQKLYGHAKVGMTEDYLEGDKIVWTRATASMDLALAATVAVKE